MLDKGNSRTFGYYFAFWRSLTVVVKTNRCVSPAHVHDLVVMLQRMTLNWSQNALLFEAAPSFSEAINQNKGT